MNGRKEGCEGKGGRGGGERKGGMVGVRMMDVTGGRGGVTNL
jgi:hypothetical protein